MVLKYDTKNLSLRFNAHKCVGCLMCLEVCPHNVFKRTQTKVALARRQACIECGACAKNCPTEALEVDSGVGCAQAYINSYFGDGEVSCDCDKTKCC